MQIISHSIHHHSFLVTSRYFIHIISISQNFFAIFLVCSLFCFGSLVSFFLSLLLILRFNYYLCFSLSTNNDLSLLNVCLIVMVIFVPFLYILLFIISFVSILLAFIHCFFILSAISSSVILYLCTIHLLFLIIHSLFYIISYLNMLIYLIINHIFFINFSSSGQIIKILLSFPLLPIPCSWIMYLYVFSNLLSSSFHFYLSIIPFSYFIPLFLFLSFLHIIPFSFLFHSLHLSLPSLHHIFLLFHFMMYILLFILPFLLFYLSFPCFLMHSILYLFLYFSFFSLLSYHIYSIPLSENYIFLSLFSSCSPPLFVLIRSFYDTHLLYISLHFLFPLFKIVKNLSLCSSFLLLSSPSTLCHLSHLSLSSYRPFPLSTHLSFLCSHILHLLILLIYLLSLLSLFFHIYIPCPPSLFFLYLLFLIYSVLFCFDLSLIHTMFPLYLSISSISFFVL